ncbi:hypothetical protein ABL78_2859 [Leptomonas seymouri]|uniref:Leucine-rich repeat protein n=1 Tax=Leptomonas seymouri TaxID=5684 RepID=A0A0N1PE62_LEPSE|nr:hypothetical protein ABL78_2859 [Leptomonas seymouri]|eukprot:KPI88033.1 hypothetical protein ABL78_2859 [Leptomonas seymouri]
MIPADCSASSTSTTAFPLQHFTEAHLSGYQLGDEALTKPFQLLPDQPPSNALYFIGRDTALSVLDLSYNRLTPAIIKPLLETIATLPMLTVLRLSGNLLGSAAQPSSTGTATLLTAHGEGDNGDALSLLKESPSNETFDCLPAPAAQLGRWLATSPPLQELCLYQCGLNDRDVHALLRGLVRQGDATLSSPSPLATLQLAGNPACTWHSVRMVLELVKDLGNKSLCVVELESAPPGTAVRFEYACTPDGHFRSGKTTIPALDEKQGDKVGVPVQESMLKELSPGQVTRFRSRRRHLRSELDGTHVLLPALMSELHAILSARRAAAAAAADSSTSVDSPPRNEAAPQAVQAMDAETEIANDNGSNGDTMGDAAVDEVDPRVEDASAAGETLETEEAHGTPDSTADAATGKLPSRRTAPPPFLSSVPRRQTPQERRAARFEAPERIARVMAEARAYRHHIHPLQVDTRTPPCADVHTHSTSSLYGSESAAATWYAQEGFILRPNGISKVLVAPVLPGSAAERRNVTLEEMEDRRLQACWCTPHNATSAANYAGTLHYHCLREGEAVRHRGGDAVAAVNSRRAQERKKAAAAVGAKQLPPIAAAEPSAADAGSPLQGGDGSAPRAYLACCGTGHSCLSTSVAMYSPLHAQRMRNILMTQSMKRMPSSAPAMPAGGARPVSSRERVTDRLNTVGRRPVHARGSSAPASSSRASGGVGQRLTEAMLRGGERAVHTTSSGHSAALNYSPVTFFSSPHVPCAAGIQVEESMGGV